MSTRNWSAYDVQTRMEGHSSDCPAGCSQHLRFTPRPYTKLMAAYIWRHRKDSAIDYNREILNDTRDGRYMNGWRWVENPSDGLRLRGTVQDIAKAEGYRTGNHGGWYIDSLQDETVHGLVFKLPSRHGKPIYVPAIQDPWTDGALIYFHDTSEDLRQAVISADQMAERYAEECRENDAKDQAEQKIADIRDEIKGILESTRGLIRELRGNCDKLTGLDQVRGLIREKIQSARQRIRDLRERKEKLESDPWESIR